MSDLIEKGARLETTYKSNVRKELGEYPDSWTGYEHSDDVEYEPQNGDHKE